jgi:hypothetical protein
MAQRLWSDFDTGREGREEYRTYYRAITLPQGIKPENVQATYRNGVLELHNPKAKGSQPKQIKNQAQHNGGSKPRRFPKRPGSNRGGCHGSV